MEIDADAPAKINLTLHVTGRRADGYHLLDSVVVFTELGDRLRLRPAPDLSLTVCGPYSDGVPAGQENLVLRAARLFGEQAAHIELEKRLPPASGIGGGSADAAATLRALSELRGRALPGPDELLSLGADVPACVLGRSSRMAGIGERLTPLPALPPVWLVLANPGLELPTKQVFAALQQPENAPMPETLPRFRTATELAVWLRMMRNDLEPPARSIAPRVRIVLDALSAQPGCLTARMSGSGATCFGLFADPLSAAAARRSLERVEPEWWVADTAIRRDTPA